MAMCVSWLRYQSSGPSQIVVKGALVFLEPQCANIYYRIFRGSSSFTLLCIFEMFLHMHNLIHVICSRHVCRWLPHLTPLAYPLLSYNWVTHASLISTPHAVYPGLSLPPNQICSASLGSLRGCSVLNYIFSI